MMFDKEENEEKYKVIYVFYVRANNTKDALDRTQSLRAEEADEKTVVRMRK